MPTVDSIVRQRDLTADVSSKIFRTDFESANNSVLIKGPMNTAADMVNSTFGLRSNISEMLGTYAEEKESFNEQFDKTISSLRESADKVKESVQAEEDNRVAVSKKAQENERARRQSAETFANAARADLQENEQTRQRQAQRLAAATRERIQDDIQTQRDNTQQLSDDRERTQNIFQAQRENSDQLIANREQIQNSVQAQRDNVKQLTDTRERIQQNAQDRRDDTEQLADIRKRNQDRIQAQRDNTERFAQQYLVAENNNRTTTDALQNLNSTRDENTNAALSNVRNLVNRFNDAVSYFNENRAVSNRMSALAGSFGNTGNFAQSLNSVGITVNENGQLRVNESRLSDALNRNSADVGAVLGRDGLAGRLDRTLELASSQRENLFPSVTDYVNDRRDEPTEYLYAAQLNQTAALARENGANFVNMFT